MFIVRAKEFHICSVGVVPPTMFSFEFSLSGAGDGSPLSMVPFEFTMSGTGGGSLLSMALVNRGRISSLT